MPDVIGSAVIEVGADARGISDDINSQAGPARRAGEHIGGGIGEGIKAGLTVLAGQAFAALLGKAQEVAGSVGRFFTEGITQASDLNEVGTALEAVFGKDAAATVQAFAATAATSLGQTQGQALDAAKTFGVFGKAAGLSGDALSGFSTDMVGLVGDLASFHNADPSEVIEAIGSGLRGEAEPLRRFGILMDDAALKAQAMQMGIGDGTSTLTTQQKVLAAQALILAQTADAQGDFAKTSEGLANQQRILSAGWDGLQTKIGALFLPVANAAVHILNDLVAAAGPLIDAMAARLAPAFEQVTAAVSSVDLSKVGLGFAALWDAMQQGDVTSDGFVGFMERIGDALHTVWDATAPLREAVGDLAGAFLDAGIPLGPLGLLFDALAPILPQIGALLQDIAVVLLDALAPVLPVVGALIGQLASTLSGVFAAALPIVADLLRQVAAALPLLTPLLLALAPVILELATAAAGLVTALLPLLPPIVDLALSALPPLVSLIQTLAPFLPTIAVGVLAMVGAFKAVKAVALGAQIATNLYAIAMGRAAAATEAGVIAQNIWGAVTKVGAAIQAAFNAVMALNPIGLIVIAIAALVAALVYFFTQTETGKAVWASFTAFLASAWESIKAAFASAWTFIQGIGQFFADLPATITGMWESLVTWFTELPGRIVSGLSSLAAQLGTWIKTAIGTLLIWTIEAVAAYITFWLELPGNIITAVQTLVPLLIGWITDAWAWITSTSAAAWDAWLTFWTELPGRIIDAVTGLLVLVGTWMIETWAAIKATAQERWADFKTFWTELPGNIITAVEALQLKAALWMLGVWASIKAKATERWEDFKTFWTELPGKVIDAVKDLQLKAALWMLEVWASIRAKVDEKWADLKSFFTDLPTKIMDTLTSLPGKMLNFGRDLIQGLIDGVKKLDPVKAVKDIADGMVDKVKGIFGIKSPSKVFAAIGVDLGKGLIAGVESMASPVEAALSGLTATGLTAAVTAGATPTGAPTSGDVAGVSGWGGGGAVTINVTVPLTDLAQLRDLEAFMDLLRVRTRMGVSP